MKKIKLIITGVTLLLTFSIKAQEAPKGKKSLEVKESFKGEYMQEVNQGDLSSVVLGAMKKRLPKKLRKYGFEDITITEVGKVFVPKSISTKLGELVGGNKALGRAQLEVANTSGEINNAVNRMYTKDVDGDWKFQVNIIDNRTNSIYKIRLSLTYNPKYIIKESKEVINYR
ncbi:hypothetical protein [Tenacibaculum sp. SDUM215027]|uniref:hypothetical protein n=1 Tax=Tenacibaculum sp. SDUM215027 TaxID=3422596 RepID=UPI003D320FC8